MKNYIIIQARINSLRFPGKIVNKIGNTVSLDLLIKRLKKSQFTNKIIIATNNYSKKSIAKFSKKHNINFFVGHDKNVLKRFYDCSIKFNLKDNDNIVRVTADCPFVDSKIIDEGLKLIDKKKVSLVSNTGKLTYPDGLDICIFKLNLLKKTYKEAKSDFDKEHVTSFMHKLTNIKKYDLV